ncbi:hypothetical protein CF54_10195 [Streptomyces sp. Tu 6176]|nr:hypothetical protein CF54_10195 [Streptomyces sp. Tu 6176]
MRATARRWSSTALAGRLQTMTSPVSFSYQRKAGMSWLLPCRMPSWLAPVWLDQSVRQGVRRWVGGRPGVMSAAAPGAVSAPVPVPLPGPVPVPVPVPSQRATVGMRPWSTASRSTSWPTPSSWIRTVPGVPEQGGCRLRRRSASRWSLRRYASSSRTARAPPVAEATADITAATMTAVSGAACGCPEGLTRRASSSSEPLRKNTSSPRTSAGTSSSSRTSSGQTTAERTPKAPAPRAAVTAMVVALSPSADWSRKSGRIPASTSMVTVETAHTVMLRPA